MYKFTAIATLLTLSALSFANTTTTEETPIYSSVRHLPVIVSNETISADSCRLSFDNGLTKEVPCTPYTSIENVAFAPLPAIPNDAAIGSTH